MCYDIACYYFNTEVEITSYLFSGAKLKRFHVVLKHGTLGDKVSSYRKEQLISGESGPVVRKQFSDNMAVDTERKERGVRIQTSAIAEVCRWQKDETLGNENTQGSFRSI